MCTFYIEHLLGISDGEIHGCLFVVHVFHEIICQAIKVIYVLEC